MNQSSERCPLCGGPKMSGTTTFSAHLGSGVVVVRGVRATVCAQCGEEWIDHGTAQELERKVNEARVRHAQVEILALV